MLNENRGRIRFFSIDEIDRLLNTSNLYIERFFLIGINTGMRMSEMLNLRVSDIDLENNVLHIRNRKDFETKSKKDRDIPIPVQLINKLHTYVKYWVQPNIMATYLRSSVQMEYLFCHEDGRKIGSFKKSFARLLERASISDACIHTMRHTYASHLAMGGVSLRTIRDFIRSCGYRYNPDLFTSNTRT